MPLFLVFPLVFHCFVFVVLDTLLCLRLLFILTVCDRIMTALEVTSDALAPPESVKLENIIIF